MRVTAIVSVVKILYYLLEAQVYGAVPVTISNLFKYILFFIAIVIVYLPIKIIIIIHNMYVSLIFNV